MRINQPYLYDSDFLLEIDNLQYKEQIIKITLLDFLEKPIKDIQGKIVSGSISIDGTSNVRRTCNLTMIADEVENNRLITINKKVEISMGIKNTTDKYTQYEYIWFPLGVYVIVSASYSNETISLQLKDKMCLLNGECGGTLPASTTFDEYDTQDSKGNWIVENPTIYQIIQEVVSHFGGEQLSKIFISDVDSRVKKVMKWIGSSPLYIVKTTQNGTTQYETYTNESSVPANADYDMYTYGDDIGYVYTDFIYPSELIGDAGTSVADILETIKNTLGNYEYFYDLDGNFIFQEKKNYLNTTQATVELEKMKNDDYLVKMDNGKSVYSFTNANLVTSFSNSPQWSMIKNDFIVWGVRTDSNDKEWPIRYHLAIDSKPQIGNTYPVFFYEDPDDGITKAKCPTVFNNIIEFPSVGASDVFYYSKEDGHVYKWNGSEQTYEVLPVVTKEITTKDWRTELYLQGVESLPYATDNGYYYTELANEWPKLYDVEKGEFREEAIKYPTDLDYYLDFIDSGASISELSISNIGRRTKVLNDDSVNCLFSPEIPNLVLINLGDDNVKEQRQECENQGQEYIQVPETIFSMIAGGGSFNSAFDAIKDLLYQYTSYNESISISCLPIYYLEPNTVITVRDTRTEIYGDYVINSMTVPLDINSTMSLSCTRAVERI
jgi:hypothetical protein